MDRKGQGSKHIRTKTKVNLSRKKNKVYPIRADELGYRVKNTSQIEGHSPYCRYGIDMDKTMAIMGMGNANVSVEYICKLLSFNKGCTDKPASMWMAIYCTIWIDFYEETCSSSTFVATFLGNYHGLMEVHGNFSNELPSVMFVGSYPHE